MNDLDKLLKLAEKQRDERSRIKGRLDGLNKSLKSKGYRGEVHAKKELGTLKSRAKSLRKSFDTKLAAFRKKYAKELAQTDR